MTIVAPVRAQELPSRMPAFLDVGHTYRALKTEIDTAVARVLESGSYVLGAEVDAFERSFAAYCGASDCVGVANGLDAVRLSLRAAGVGEGDEVIVSAHTFIATWLAILDAGARPVPVDAEPDTMLIDADGILRALTPRTRAVLVVPLYGLPVDLAGIRDVLAARGIPVIEDAAQAHGATLRGRRVGTLGDIAAFSFYPGKNLGAFGDGGGVVTDRSDWADAIRRWANYGAARKYHHEETGTNSRLDELQAAVLSVKLRHLDDWTARRRAVAATYAAMLADIPGLRLPVVPPGSDPAWHLFVARHALRDELAARLADRGVQTLLHYPVPPHRSGALRGGFGNISLPVTDAICATCISLPIGPHMTTADAERVALATRECLADMDRVAPLRSAAC